MSEYNDVQKNMSELCCEGIKSITSLCIVFEVYPRGRMRNVIPYPYIVGGGNSAL